MPYAATYSSDAPSREAVDALPGLALMEFGVDWCPHCQAAQPAIAAALTGHPEWAHLKIEDGPGRRLGRTFRVKLWPTVIGLKDGVEVGRVIRPTSEGDLQELLTRLTAA